ncbi:hypothetical protein ACE02U_14785 [Shewanella xiamenensis]|uniref:hypothetical protein n=1 Tax=Shewanella xiamenensis TaxID=332186 RepID=UPI00313DEA29
MTKRQESTPSIWLLSGGLVVIHIMQWIAEEVAAQFSDLPVVFGLLPFELICLISIGAQAGYTLFVMVFVSIAFYRDNKLKQ